MSDAFLADAQKRLRRLIAWPEGVRSALAEEPAGTPPLTSLVRSDARLAAEDRLDVYANAYFYRIHDVLAEDFPTLAARVGADAFHDLATSYLAVCPSRHPSLRWVGSRLADFLARHAAAEGLRARFPWAADLARLEAETENVFDAAEVPAAERASLADLAPEAWNRLPLSLRPCVRLLRVEWPVHEARRALREGREAAALEPATVRLCLWRRDEQVVWREPDEPEMRALEAVAEGIAFGALCERIAETVGEADAAAHAAGWLAGWLDDGLIRAIH